MGRSGLYTISSSLTRLPRSPYLTSTVAGAISAARSVVALCTPQGLIAGIALCVNSIPIQMVFFSIQSSSAHDLTSTLAAHFSLY